MATQIKWITVTVALCAALSVAVYAFFPVGWLLTLCITLGTVSYHFCMRLAVGYAVNAVMRNRADPNRWRYRERSFEKKLYAVLRVRKWRGRMPTYAPDSFALSQHSYGEIAQAMCQAETVHEIIALLSFLPIATVPWFGAFPVFLITSILAAAYDLLFVILQRYNRPTVLRAAEHKKKREAAHTVVPPLPRGDGE